MREVELAAATNARHRQARGGEQGREHALKVVPTYCVGLKCAKPSNIHEKPITNSTIKNNIKCNIKGCLVMDFLGI